MADGHCRALGSRPGQQALELLAHGLWRQLMVEKDIPPGTGYMMRLCHLQGKGIGTGTTVQKPESVLVEGFHQPGHQYRMAGGQAALVVVQAHGLGQALMGLLQKGQHFLPVHALVEKSGRGVFSADRFHGQVDQHFPPLDGGLACQLRAGTGHGQNRHGHGGWQLQHLFILTGAGTQIIHYDGNSHCGRGLQAGSKQPVTEAGE